MKRAGYSHGEAIPQPKRKSPDKLGKLREEFFELLPPTIFFFVALHIVMFVRVLMLEGTGSRLPLQFQLPSPPSFSARQC